MIANLLAAGVIATVALTSDNIVTVDPAPAMYLTTDYAAPVLVFDSAGLGLDVFWLDDGQTVQASLYALADGVDWLYVHDSGRSGWVRFSYDTMKVRFEYDHRTN